MLSLLRDTTYQMGVLEQQESFKVFIALLYFIKCLIYKHMFYFK